MRAPCEASSFLTFGLGLGYGGPLLDLLSEDEGALFNLYGEFSSGKTLIARALHSQAGRASKSDLATYGITPRGVEELCFSRNDWAVVFDEESRTTGTEQQRRERIRTIAFTVPSGRGTIRSEWVGRSLDLRNLTWRVFGLSSGEKPLEDAGTRRVAGEQLRHIDIQVPRRADSGIFDRLEGSQRQNVAEAIRLAEQVETTITANYGVARGRYLEELVSERSTVEARIPGLINDIIEEVGAGADSWERRFARKFAIVGAGAILAAEWNVAPFSAEHARECIIDVYRVARRSVFSVQEATETVLQRIRRAIRDDTRFPRLEKGEALPRRLRTQAWGFRRRRGDDGEIIAIYPSRFEGLAPSKPSAEAVLDVLLERGVALSGADGKRHLQLAVQGFDRVGRARWVCLRASSL